jgi:hypothetical protein
VTAGALERWRDTPRSRRSDAVYVNSALLFLLRMANVVVRRAGDGPSASPPSS